MNLISEERQFDYLANCFRQSTSKPENAVNINNVDYHILID